MTATGKRISNDLKQKWCRHDPKLQAFRSSRLNFPSNVPANYVREEIHVCACACVIPNHSKLYTIVYGAPLHSCVVDRVAVYYTVAFTIVRIQFHFSFAIQM